MVDIAVVESHEASRCFIVSGGDSAKGPLDPTEEYFDLFLFLYNALSNIPCIVAGHFFKAAINLFFPNTAFPVVNHEFAGGERNLMGTLLNLTGHLCFMERLL